MYHSETNDEELLSRHSANKIVYPLRIFSRSDIYVLFCLRLKKIEQEKLCFASKSAQMFQENKLFGTSPFLRNIFSLKLDQAFD